jgi:AcrR family transcriptional regulator
MVETAHLGGRVHQKARTRSAIVAAAHDLAETGGEVTMPAIAAAARVSEATAYRYFPDLVSLLRVTVSSEDLEEQMRPVADSPDPVHRVGHAAEVLARAVLRRQGAVRAMIAGTITRPGAALERPGIRFGLIEHALAPWVEGDDPPRQQDVEQLVRDLAIIISAESLFSLTDLCGLSPDDAVTSLVHTARCVTAATVTAPPGQPRQATSPADPTDE